MTLKPNEVCKHSNSCKYHNNYNSFCQGTNPNRNNIFECNYNINENGNISEGQNRNVNDLTGKMQFIQE